MNQPLIRLKNLHKSFGDNRVLNGIDLNIFKGEITSIIGKSGGGKSVLLKHIIGLLQPDSGQILFQGKPISEMKRSERKTLKQKFSYMFQGTALFDSMTVYENISLPLSETTSLSGSQIRRRVQEKMNQLDLGYIDDHYPSQISGGMKKRVALARALVTDPEIVLFDEPTTGLDPIRKSTVHQMISDYQKQFGFTGVVVSHEIPDIFFISQRIAMLNEGKIIFEGIPDDIQHVSDPVVQEFIHGLERRRDDLIGKAALTEGEKKFKEEMARLHRHKIPFSVIHFTITNLGEINQKAGHETGQSAMNNFSNLVKQSIRINDTCSRIGTDTLMLVLPNTDIEQAREVCTKLSHATKKDEIQQIQPFPGFCFSISAGIAQAHEGISLDRLTSNVESMPDILYEFSVC